MFDHSAPFYDAFYDAGGKDYGREAAQLVRHIEECRPGARSLLDVACGTGRHLEQLMDRFECTGIDTNEEMLAIAARRCPAVPLVQADMRAFALGRRFDVVVCLFSSIGYVVDEDGLRRAMASMAVHLEPGGVLLVEPWFGPDDWRPGKIHAVFVDQPQLKAVRMVVSEQIDDRSVLDFHYLVGTPEAVRPFTEHHELGLFTPSQYEAAVRAAGLEPSRDPEGFTGRGLVVGRKPETNQD